MFAVGELSLDCLNVEGDSMLLGGDVAQLSRDLRIICLADASPHELDDIGALAIEHRQAGAEPLEPLAPT
ncbi:MAG: hypothetical protein ACRCSO_04145 [Sphingomonas sp.]